MRTTFYFLFLLAVVVFPIHRSLAECVLTQSDTSVTIENEYVRLSFAPGAGGKCSSFFLKEPEWELVQWPKFPAFQDRLWNVGKGFDLPGASYSLKVLRDDPGEVSVRLETNPTTPGLQELHVAREITLRQGSRRIELNFRFTNEGTEPLPAAFWSMHALTLSQESAAFWAPTRDGTDSVYRALKRDLKEEDPRNRTMVGQDRFLDEPPRGWQAMVGETSGYGVAWSVPESILGYIYNFIKSDVSTFEMLFNEVPVKPGEEFVIPTSMLILKEMPRVDAADAGLAGSLAVPEEVQVSQPLQVRARLLAARPGIYAATALLQPFGVEDITPIRLQQKVELGPSEVGEVVFDLVPKMLGTSVVKVQIEAGDETVLQMERPLIVGTSSEDYVLLPTEAKVGRFNPQWLTRTRAMANTTDRSAEWAEAIGITKPLNLDYIDVPLTVAHPLAGRPPKVLFCEGIWSSFEVVETIQRVEMDHDHVVCLVPKQIYFLSNVSLTDLLWAPCAQAIADRLAETRYDVIVMTAYGAKWAQIPEDIQQMIVKAVKEDGTRLIFATDYIDRRALADSFETTFRQHLFAKTFAKEEKSCFDRLERARAGKGEIITYPQPRKKSFVYDEKVFGMPAGFDIPGETMRHYTYSDFARIICEAAGRTDLPRPTLKLTAPTMDQADLAESSLAEVSVSAPATVKTVIRNLHLEPVFEKTTIVTDPATGTVAVAPPHLAAGRYVVEAQTLDPEGKVYAWDTADVTVTSSIELNVTTPEAVDRGEDVSVAVRCTGLESDGASDLGRIVLKAIDTDQRLVYREVKPASATGTVAFSVPTQDQLTKVLVLRTTLLRADQPYVIEEQSVAVRLHRKIPFFVAELWRNAEWSKNYLHVNTFCGGADFSAWLNMDNVLWDLPTPGFYLHETETEELIRKPCLTDPEFLETSRAWITERHISPAQANHEELGVIWADEWNYPCQVDIESNFCHSKSCLAHLRAMLRSEYGTIGALNRSWNSEFASWDDVVPPKLEQVKAEPDRWAAAWADHRRNAGLVVREYFDFINGVAREKNPLARLGLSGTRNPNAFNGMDWWLIMQSSPFIATYGGPQVAYSRSFKRPDGILSTWIGYDKDGDDEREAEREIWENLFQGRDGVMIYTTTHSPLYFGDGEPRRSGVGTRRAAMQVQGGRAHLIKDSRFDDSGIAVLFSMDSVRAVTLDAYRGWNMNTDDLGNNQQSLFGLLSDLGLNFTCLADAQIRDGALDNGVRLLIIGYGTAMSPETCARVRTFVEKGGMVIADVIPATRDGHCKPLDRGALDDLFGVDQAGRTPLFTAEALQVNDTRTDVVAGVPDLRLTTGQAQGVLETATGQAPAVIVNQFGRGSAVLLNFMIRDYAIFALGGYGGEVPVVANAKREKTRAVQRIFLDLLERCQITPAVTLTVDGQPTRKSPIYVYHAGEAMYVGIMPNELPEEGAEAEIEFGRDGWIYDCIEGRRIAGGSEPAQRARVRIENEQARLYAVLPEPVEALRLQAPARVVRGDTAEINLTRVCASADRAFAEVRVTRPDGEIAWLLRSVVPLVDNQGTLRVPFALNDPPGEWTLTAVDAATGAKGAAVVVVE